jgi:hypothetical protein
MAETYVSESQTVALLAAIGNRHSTTGTKAVDEERSSGARASSLSWVLVGGGTGGGGSAGLRRPMYGAKKGVVGQEGALGRCEDLGVRSAHHGGGVVRRRK